MHFNAQHFGTASEAYVDFLLFSLVHILNIFLQCNVLLQEASEIVEYAYNEYATAPQRMAIHEEFYGPTFSLFKV